MLTHSLSGAHPQSLSNNVHKCLCDALWALSSLELHLQEEEPNCYSIPDVWGGRLLVHTHRKVGKMAFKLSVLKLLIIVFFLRCVWKGEQERWRMCIDAQYTNTWAQMLTDRSLWVQCETPEFRFLKCSIEWDDLTIWFFQVSASLLHSFYSLENTTLSLAYFPPSPLFYILVLSLLLFLRFFWVVVFSLVIMTEPYASHDASGIELGMTNLSTWLH